MRWLARTSFFALGLIAMFVLGFSFRDLRRGTLPAKSAFGSIVGNQTQAGPHAIIRHAYNLILQDFYRPIQATPLKYAAISGLMASLGDPHTMFLPPRENADFAFTTTAKFVGIGCSLTPEPRGVKISEVFDDSPALAAGLKSGDVIVGVEGKKIAGIDQDKIVSRIRGKEGTSVRLTILRNGKGLPIQIVSKRASVTKPTVASKFFEDSKVGYVAIGTFSEPTVAQFDKKIVQLKAKGMKGLVFDLRGDPGGLLETAVELLSRFVEDKTVIRMKGRDGTQEVATTLSGLKENFGIPMAVLIDEDSASAAEIFSGVLRDYGLVKLVGTHSYGKASVQNISGMIDNAGVKITIARYYLPMTPDIGRKVDEDGQYISGGLHPDIEVKLDPNGKYEFGNPKMDPQLARAIAVVTGH